MQNKVCGSCRIEKPITEFHLHSRDGYQTRCKTCKRNDSRIQNRQPKRRQYNYEKYRKWMDKGGLREYRRRPEVMERVRVGAIVQQAIRSGKIERQPCLICGEKAHAHHDNYSKPLDIKWLCSKHHAEEHRNLKADKGE